MSQIRFAKLHHAFANGATAKVNQRVSKDTTDSNVDMHSSQWLKNLKKSHIMYNIASEASKNIQKFTQNHYD